MTASIREGLTFLWRHRLVRTLTLLSFGLSLTGGGVAGSVGRLCGTRPCAPGHGCTYRLALCRRLSWLLCSQFASPSTHPARPYRLDHLAGDEPQPALAPPARGLGLHPEHRSSGLRLLEPHLHLDHDERDIPAPARRPQSFAEPGQHLCPHHRLGWNTIWSVTRRSAYPAYISSSSIAHHGLRAGDQPPHRLLLSPT